MTEPTPRIPAADDIEVIRRRLEEIKAEKERALNAPEEGEKVPKVEWYGLGGMIPSAELRAHWNQDAATWQASVARSGR